MKRFLSVVLAVVFAYMMCSPASAGSQQSAVDTPQLAVLAQPEQPGCKSALLADVSSGRVLYEFNADEQLYPASVTKIMTMLLVAEAIDCGKITLDDTVAASANACSKGGSQIWLEEGEVMTVRELLLATAVGSANDAATALGEYVAGSESGFVDMMNERAAALGMTLTHFDNATGLDDSSQTHLSTARDIAIMSCELMKHAFIEEFTTVWMDSLRNGETQLVNTNKLVRFFSGTTGIKTGTTSKAGNCVSASARRDGLHLVAVIMGSTDSTVRFESAKSLLSWGFSNYAMVTPEPDLSAFEPVKVLYGVKNEISATAAELAPVLVEKALKDSVTYELIPLESIEAPVEAGDALGIIRMMCSGSVIAQYELTASEAVGRLTVLGAARRLLCCLAGNRDRIE